MTDSAAARAIEALPPRFNAAVDLLEPNLARGLGDKVAVIDHRGETTYRALAAAVDRMAAALLGLGIVPGQRILLCLLDTVDFPIAFLGSIKAGIVPVPLNTLLVTDDYRWLLDDSEAVAVIVSDALTPQWREIAQDHPHVRFLSSGDGPWPELTALTAQDRNPVSPADTARGDIAFWLYTSGSTGRPKAAMHRHASLRLTANFFGIGVVGYCETDIVLSVAKQFFAYGLGNALTFPLAAGATVVLHYERATAAAIATLVRTHGVTILNGVPTFFAGWLASDDPGACAPTPTLRTATSAGECLPAHVGEAFRARFGTDIIDGLGSTEMLHIYLAQQPGAVRYGCTGRAVPGYELRILDETGAEAKTGEIGELQVRGATMAAGYWNNDAKTRATFVDGWMRTGDTYRQDAEGWYYHAGRGDDMLKVGGIYVSPLEVEDALTCHDDVVEAAVVGAADSDGLIKPRAHVVLRKGACADHAMENRLKAHVKAKLAPYKYPRWIVFTEALPKTATGKIQRFLLRSDP